MRTFIYNILKFGSVIPILFSLVLLVKFKDFPNKIELDRALDQNYQVIMFGSSVDKYASPQDTDTRSISELLGSLIVSKTIGISGGAYQADLYLEFAKYIAKQPYKPQIVIIETNLRSFSPEWDLRPSYQFVKERRILQGFPFYKLNFYEIDEGTFNKSPVYKHEDKVGTVKDFLTIIDSMETICQTTSTTCKPNDNVEATQNGFILFYMYSLNNQHRKVKSIANISKVLSDSDILPLFFIPPIDYKSAENLFGEEFTLQIVRNVSVIKSTIAENNGKVLDLSLSLDSSYFSYNKIPNEHLNQIGRYFVAKKLADYIKSDNFFETNLPSSKQ